MEDTSLSAGPTTSSAPLVELPQRSFAIAPWWHTLGILVLLGGWAAFSGKRTHTYEGTPHFMTYASQMMMTWMLFGCVVAGVAHRGAFFFATLRNKAQSLLADAGYGLAIYVGIYITVVTLAAIIAAGVFGFRALHRPSPSASVTQQSTPNASTPIPPPTPTSVDPLDPLAKSRFHFDSKTVLAIAPKTPLDLALWFLVSFTAAFCEEHIFRGYMLTQALAFFGRAGMPRILTTAFAVLATSLLFGSLHLYEGIGGALLISALGVFYSVVSLKFGNLRAVIVAHFMQDFVAGFFLFLFHRLHAS